MPIIYLSPSTQEYNPFIGGGNEEIYMNLIADNMVPYLRSNGIQYARNTTDMTAAGSIAQSNSGNYDLHLALHSNAAPPQQSGALQGCTAYYYPTSRESRRAATIIAENLKEIYPDPALVTAAPTTHLGELSKTRAPAVLIEFAYHDNVEDAAWIRLHLQAIARIMVYSLTEYFDIPFINPEATRFGIVNLQSGYLNIHSKPDITAPVIARAQNGSRIIVNGQWKDWYVVNYHTFVGYANARYIIF